MERNKKDDHGNRQAYFGTGETFVFSLYPCKVKYEWIGMKKDSIIHSSELFMAADQKMFTIGGGYIIIVIKYMHRYMFINMYMI